MSAVGLLGVEALVSTFVVLVVGKFAECAECELRGRDGGWDGGRDGPREDD